MAYFNGKKIYFSPHIHLGEGATPTGDIQINENGYFDVSDYANARVYVIGNEDLLINGTIAGMNVDERFFVENVRYGAFAECAQLEKVQLYAATKIGNYAFAWCSNLATVELDKEISSIGQRAFYMCKSLEEITFKAVGTIGAYAFNGCSTLNKVVIDITNGVIPTLENANAFTATPIASGNGYIYFPDALVASAKTATNWSTYANQIKPKSELGV